MQSGGKVERRRRVLSPLLRSVKTPQVNGHTVARFAIGFQSVCGLYGPIFACG